MLTRDEKNALIELDKRFVARGLPEGSVSYELQGIGIGKLRVTKPEPSGEGVYCWMATGDPREVSDEDIDCALKQLVFFELSASCQKHGLDVDDTVSTIVMCALIGARTDGYEDDGDTEKATVHRIGNEDDRWNAIYWAVEDLQKRFVERGLTSAHVHYLDSEDGELVYGLMRDDSSVWQLFDLQDIKAFDDDDVDRVIEKWRVTGYDTTGE